MDRNVYEDAEVLESDPSGRYVRVIISSIATLFGILGFHEFVFMLCYLCSYRILIFLLYDAVQGYSGEGILQDSV